MSASALYAKIELLPEHLKQQVLDYIEFLLSREGKAGKESTDSKTQTTDPVAKNPLKAGFGGAKGMFVMSPDFDEPVEDFKDYM